MLDQSDTMCECVCVCVCVCAKRDIYYCEGVVIKLYLTTYYSINCKMSFLKFPIIVLSPLIVRRVIMNYQPVFHSQHLRIYVCGSPR